MNNKFIDKDRQLESFTKMAKNYLGDVLINDEELKDKIKIIINF